MEAREAIAQGLSENIPAVPGLPWVPVGPVEPAKPNGRSALTGMSTWRLLSLRIACNSCALGNSKASLNAHLQYPDCPDRQMLLWLLYAQHKATMCCPGLTSYLKQRDLASTITA